jgi:tyrosine decarboxylase/aspartate 1-decarboxylase
MIDSVQKLIDDVGEKNKGVRLDQIFSPDWTPPDSICKTLFNAFFEQNPNLFVPKGFPEAVGCLEKALKFLATVFNQQQPSGQIVGGSTEGLLTAMEAAERYYKTKENRSLHIIAAESAHMSLHKLLQYKNIPDKNMHWLPVDRYCQPNINQIAELARKYQPCFIFTTASTVDFGTVDPVSEISSACRDLDVWIHIDAASGGMILPFSAPNLNENNASFITPGVKSLTVDLHKRGLAPLACSFVLFKETEYLDSLTEISAYTPALGLRASFSGSFPGISAIWAWALFEKYGLKGYREIVKYCLSLRNMLAERLMDKGLNLYEGNTQVPMVVIPVEDAVNTTNTLLLQHNTFVENSIKPCGLDGEYLRVGIMPHNTQSSIERFSENLFSIV